MLDNQAVNLEYFEKVVAELSDKPFDDQLLKILCESAIKELKQHRAYFKHSSFIHSILREYYEKGIKENK